MSYAKLHGEMLASSIWSESDTTRLVWVTMLLMSDRDGMVRASLTGLAHQARVSIESCTAALRTLMGPDPESRDRTTGERVIEVVGGYQILNYERYQDLGSADDYKEKARLRQQRKRSRDARHARVTPCHAASQEITHVVEKSTVQKSTSEARETLLDGFAEFWDVYAKKVDRPASERAWKALGPDLELAATVTARAKAYVESTPDKAFRKHPATWLRARGWEDEIIAPSNGKPSKPPTNLPRLNDGRPFHERYYLAVGHTGCDCGECIAYRTREGRK